MPAPAIDLENGLELRSVPRGDGGARPASYWRPTAAPAAPSGRPPLLAIAGLGLDGRVFSRVADLGRDRDLVLVNLANESPSPRPSMADYGREAMAALDAAGHADRPAVILGSSFGGMVALAAALDHPERTAALVLLGTGAAWHRVPGRLRLAARFHRFLPRRSYARLFAAFMLPPFRYPDAEVRLDLRRQMLHRTKNHIGDVLGAMRTFDEEARVGSVAAPTLVLHGAGDGVIPPPAGRFLAEHIPGAVLRILPDCGHLPQVARPAETVEAVRAFLGERGL